MMIAAVTALRDKLGTAGEGWVGVGWRALAKRLSFGGVARLSALHIGGAARRNPRLMGGGEDGGRCHSAAGQAGYRRRGGGQGGRAGQPAGPRFSSGEAKAKIAEPRRLRRFGDAPI